MRLGHLKIVVCFSKSRFDPPSPTLPDFEHVFWDPGFGLGPGDPGLAGIHCGLCLATVESHSLYLQQHYYSTDLLGRPVDDLCGSEHGTDAVQGGFVII